MNFPISSISLTFLILLSTFVSSAQEKVYSIKVQKETKNIVKTTIAVPFAIGNYGIYTYIPNSFGTPQRIERLDSNLNLVATSIDFDDAFIKKERIAEVFLFQKKLLLITGAFEGKSGKMMVRRVETENLHIGEPKEILTIPGLRDVINIKSALFPNENRILLTYKRELNDDTLADGIVILDNQLQLIWSKELKYHYKNESEYPSFLVKGNQVYYVRKEYEKRGRDFEGGKLAFKFFVGEISENGSSVKESECFANGSLVLSSALGVLNSKPVVAGYYTSAEKGYAVQGSFLMSKNESNDWVTSNHPLSPSFVPKITSEYVIDPELRGQDAQSQSYQIIKLISNSLGELIMVGQLQIAYSYENTRMNGTKETISGTESRDVMIQCFDSTGKQKFVTEVDCAYHSNFRRGSFYPVQVIYKNDNVYLYHQDDDLFVNTPPKEAHSYYTRVAGKREPELDDDFLTVIDKNGSQKEYVVTVKGRPAIPMESTYLLNDNSLMLYLRNAYLKFSLARLTIE